MRSGRVVAQSRHNNWSLALIAYGWLPRCILRRVISAACSRQTAWQVAVLFSCSHVPSWDLGEIKAFECFLGNPLERF